MKKEKTNLLEGEAHPKQLKNIKDFLPFYLGCECQVSYKQGSEIREGIGINLGLDLQGYGQRTGYWCIFKDRNSYVVEIERITLILRKLSDMTEEERVEADLSRGDGDGCDNPAIPEAYEFKYLLSKHFDLFGLIESNLAIDASKLKK